MKRLLWLGAGLAIGALVVRKVNQVARAYSPSGLAGSARESAVGLRASVADFIADVREGMAEREGQINEAFQRGVTLDEVFTDEGGYDDVMAQGRVTTDHSGPGGGNGAGVRR